MSIEGLGSETARSEAPATARVAVKIDIVEIGAGQAGLSSAYHLKRLGLVPDRGFVVLDQSPEAGGAWQFRWPSLTLSTVNRIHDLPGMSFTEAIGETSEQVEAAVAVPRYFAAYEKAFALRSIGRSRSRSSASAASGCGSRRIAGYIRRAG